MNYPQFKVCCICWTFNQSKYIIDTLNGFTMQQTSFPFVCCIVDDASTDGEQDVIRKYLEKNFDFSEGSVAFHKETDYAHITYAQHKTNKQCYFAVLYLKENHYSQRKPKMQYLSEWRNLCEYNAMCEGDDYWITSSKLQEQADILDKYQNISICSGGYQDKKDGVFGDVHLLNLNNGDDFIYTYDDWKKYWLAKTLTIMYRIADLEDYNQKTKNYKYTRDTHLIHHLLMVGNGYYFSKVLGVYNIQPGGICSMISKKQKAIDWYNCWNELYIYNRDEISRIRAFRARNAVIRYGFPNISNKLVFLRDTIKMVRRPEEVGILLKSIIKVLFVNNKQTDE